MKRTSLWNIVQKISHDMLNSVVNKHISSKIEPSLLYLDFSNPIAFSKRTESVKFLNLHEQKRAFFLPF